jgi:hypothetical protein
VTEFVHGVQHDLFLDAGVLLLRKEAFARERTTWLASNERTH